MTPAREPEWPDEALALAVHARQLAEHGGIAGLRDLNLLSSALARPRNRFAYGDPAPDLADLAASLAFGIVTNHPFVDGNKRSGYVLCRLFLLLNGADLLASADEKYAAFYQLAAGNLTEAQLCDWLRGHLTNVIGT